MCLQHRGVGNVVHVDGGEEMERVFQSKQNDQYHVYVSVHVTALTLATCLLACVFLSNTLAQCMC